MKSQVVERLKVHAGEKVPVFPLPNAILFPHVELPLYIFEPRYQQMLEDCMKGNSLMAISLLKKGWEAYQEPFPAYDVVGVGYVKLSIQNTEGNSNIILKGITRAKISEYLQWEPYPIAKVNPIEETSAESKEIVTKTKKLLKLFIEKVLRTKKGHEDELRTLEKMTDSEELSSIVAHTSNIDFHAKQEILETFDLGKKLDRLTEILESELREIYLRKKSSS
ncbi:MAG: LON peptidase substrate-binding domain-containing protein [Chlamydiae bacterium]|nr:LON peptidase substrate-binding domain-containing protein [Chlamydiota bacterium]MBI3277601.1 LON peptidase substrate-binding domain-containing protein [Chlamydiota bacterium]